MSSSFGIYEHEASLGRCIPRRRVDDVIAIMARKGYITIYKSKNVRIRLGWEKYPETS